MMIDGSIEWYPIKNRRHLLLFAQAKIIDKEKHQHKIKKKVMKD